MLFAAETIFNALFWRATLKWLNIIFLNEVKKNDSLALTDTHNLKAVQHRSIHVCNRKSNRTNNFTKDNSCWWIIVNLFNNHCIWNKFTTSYDSNQVWKRYIDFKGYKYNELSVRCGPQPPTTSSTTTSTMSSTDPQLAKKTSAVSLKESTAAVNNRKATHFTTTFILNTSNAILFF